LGTNTKAVVLSTKANATWFDLTIGPGEDEAWYENFLEDSSGEGVRVTLTLTGNTTGDLHIDEVLLVQPDLYDGKYYALTAGPSDYLLGDNFTFSDNVSNEGRIQTTIARFYSKSLPHASSSETYPDAT